MSRRAALAGRSPGADAFVRRHRCARPSLKVTGVIVFPPERSIRAARGDEAAGAVSDRPSVFTGNWSFRRAASSARCLSAIRRGRALVSRPDPLRRASIERLPRHAHVRAVRSRKEAAWRWARTSRRRLPRNDYLEGFVLGSVHGARPPRAGHACGASRAAPAPAASADPQRAATGRWLRPAASSRAEEQAKRAEDPARTLGRIPRPVSGAATTIPQGHRHLRWRNIYGLFYVAPAQDSFMCRLADPRTASAARQLRGSPISPRSSAAAIATSPPARTCSCGRSRPRTRPNVLDAPPRSRPVIAGLRRRQHPQRHRHADRRHRSAGAHRHAPAARDGHHHILNDRGAVRPAAQVQHRLSTAAAASRCSRIPTTSASTPSRCGQGKGIAPGVYFRMQLGGITGHKRVRARMRRACSNPVKRPRRRRHGARVHRTRRPHQPQEGAAQVLARTRGARKFLEAAREDGLPPCALCRRRSAIAPRPTIEARPSRHPPADGRQD